MNIIIKTTGLAIGLALSVYGCGATRPPEISEGHIQAPAAVSDDIPPAVTNAVVVPKPEQRPRLETYTVIVNQVPVRELLFSMARDAKLNLDIDNNIEGVVTMNAIDQTLAKILERLAAQVAITYYLEADTLHIMADTPYLQTYKIDYLNMSRVSTGNVVVSTEISSTGGGASTGNAAGGAASGGNNSNTMVENTSVNRFWNSMALNVANILGEKTKAKGDSKSTDIEVSENIILNRESGILGVRATAKQHKQVQTFLIQILGSAKRQVLIEATIAEVTLSDRYQAGIDWSLVSVSDPDDNITQSLIGGNLGQAPNLTINTVANTAGGNLLTTTLKALETFGDVKVLSSPKVMALNNQTAMLKVVDNQVYFTTDVEVSQAVSQGGVATALAVVDTEVQTVPIGFVMSVTPFIDENDIVMMNVRPTISRIVDTVLDPNPELAKAGVTSEIPVIQVREIESMLKINNGDTAVIGGLMQDQVNKQNSGIPILSSIPFLGALFSYQDDQYVKSELVIFIRPVVMHNASLEGDLKDYRRYLQSVDQP